MPRKVSITPREATLVACAVAELTGTCTGVTVLCEALARVENWSPVRVRYWLGRLWGEGLASNGTTELTVDGWLVFRGLRWRSERSGLRGAIERRVANGEMPEEDAAIWMEAA